MPEKIAVCPVCGDTRFTEFMRLPDHFLSKEEFVICQCTGCGFRFVNPRPGPEEIGRYYQSDEYISHGVKKRDLISRVYSLARVYSLKGKFALVKKFSRQGKVLDIGCGTGEFLATCRGNGFEVAGVEPNDQARNYAQSVNGLTVTAALNMTAGGPGSFACITMWHVLEHVHDLKGTLDTIRTLLSKGGVFIAAVPNCASTDAAEYGSFWAAWDVPRHLYHFTEPTMRKLAEATGFRVVQVLPQKLDAFYVSMLSEKYRSGKISYLRAFFNGLKSNLAAGKNNRGHSSLIFVLAPEQAH